MAMLNVQGSILNEAVGGERQPQEEVELTELLPVKQSRIRENGILQDAGAGASGNEDADANVDADADADANANANATDALKVLRSFTAGDCNDEQEQEFRLQSFNYCGKVERRGKEGSKEARGGKQRKGIDTGRGVLDDAGKRKIDDREFRGDAIQKTGQLVVVHGRKLVRAKSSRKKPLGSVACKEEGARRNGEARIERNAFDAEKEVVVSEYEEEEEAMYLGLERSTDFSDDEVYVFRREPADPGATLDTEQHRRDYSTTTDGVLFDRAVLPRQGAYVDDIGAKVEEMLESTEKESGLSIIAANFLLESENNNLLVRSSGEKNREAYASSLGLADSSSNQSSTSSSSSSSSSSLSLSSASASTSTSTPFSRLIRGKRKEKREDKDTEKEKEQEGGSGSEKRAAANDNEQSEQKKYCCVVCEARFKGSGGLRNHYKIVHGAGPIFKCDECGKEFPLKERLKLHVRTHTGFKPYKCPECEKSFARGGQLVQHRRTHSQVKPYRCGLCSGTFTCAANLALHVKRHNGQKDHKCDICGRAFVRRDALKKHLECLHRDVKSFLCVICNKTFKGHLPQHMRTHARDRPHGCATCGQRFAQKSQLTVHQRTHSGQRPFRCLVCWQAFAHSTALKLHTRRHTGERPFKCAECNAGFTQLPHWKKHMKCIHGRNEPYACKRCNSFFRIKNDLECHEKTCHPEIGNGVDASPAALPNEIAENDPPPLPAQQQTHTHTHTLALAQTQTQTQTQTLTQTQTQTQTQQPQPPSAKYRVMTVERMRLLLAVLLKRISKQERLDELGFGKRLIDQVLHDSLISAGREPVAAQPAGHSELETLTKNLEIFLKWTVPKEHWENFRRLNKTPEDILETLTATSSNPRLLSDARSKSPVTTHRHLSIRDTILELL